MSDGLGFECPTCKSRTTRLIASPDVDGIHCPNCYKNPGYADPTKTAKHWSLHDTVLQDKNGTKITAGKSWEIDHRTVDRESGKTINSVTGKPAQY